MSGFVLVKKDVTFSVARQTPRRSTPRGMFPMSRAIELSRRQFLGTVGSLPLMGLPAMSAQTPKATRMPQRVCVVLFDGFGTDYYELSTMPTLRKWAKEGFHKRIKSVMPTVTNTNMAGVCCGVHASEHGIT